ncbi:hypothetical protein CDD83_7994 [Cordyceps sp. RAO-2017]|nr:hypothetical protein CDD83_7994 [Cordyceps sp. RAO-2017]
MSPESCSIIALNGLVESEVSLDESFDLGDVDLPSWKIEHDSSFTRKDNVNGNYTHVFDKPTWAASLREFRKCGKVIDAKCFGRVRVARILDTRRKNPKSVYDLKNAGHSIVESARAQLTLGTRKGVRLDFLRMVFEQERLPLRLGWRPREWCAPVDEILDVAVEGLQVSPILRNATDGVMADRYDIIRTLRSRNPDFLKDVRKLLRSAGFRRKAIFTALDKLENEKARQVKLKGNRPGLNTSKDDDD